MHLMPGENEPSAEPARLASRAGTGEFGRGGDGGGGECHGGNIAHATDVHT